MILLFAAALYVGNQACVPCHSEISRAYAGTPMAQSSGRVTGGLTPGFFQQADSGVSYRMESSGAVLLSKGERSQSRRLDFFIGSGTAGRSFLYFKDGFLFQAPVTWYSQLARWDASPGYEHDTVSRWSRAVEPNCLFCHSSQVRIANGTQNGYADPPFAQPGVGCERCHGPASEHIQGHAHLVNPAQLLPDRRDAICAQCHMSGEARITRAGQQLSAYRPGDRLSSYAAFFVRADSTSVKATSYVERLSASACKRAASDRLWCGTCHDPHRLVSASERADWYRRKCLTCHPANQCSRGADCVTCHMPKAKVFDVSHAVLTDHSIQRIPGSLPVGATHSWQLRPFSPADSGDRELGLAYAELSGSTGDERQRKEAIRLLSSIIPDAESQIQLANLYLREGDLSQAARLYAAALQKQPDSIVALVNLGKLYGSAGKLNAAIALWRDALQRNTCQAEAGVNLITALQVQGRREAAESVRNGQRSCSFE